MRALLKRIGVELALLHEPPREPGAAERDERQEEVVHAHPHDARNAADRGAHFDKPTLTCS
jgi:hypothetical protein